MVVMDVRHPLKPQEVMLVDWCANADVPLHVLLNKCDKLNKGRAQNALLKVSRYLEAAGGASTAQLFSALKRTGIEQAHEAAGRWLDVA